MVNLCAAILILTMEENVQHFWHIMLCYFKKGKNSTETQTSICAVYGPGAVMTVERGKSGLRSFAPESAHWMIMLHGRVAQLKLIAINLRH